MSKRKQSFDLQKKNHREKTVSLDFDRHTIFSDDPVSYAYVCDSKKDN